MGFKFKSLFGHDANGSPVEDVADTSGQGFPYTDEDVKSVAADKGIDVGVVNELLGAKHLIESFQGAKANEYEFTNAEVAAVVATSVKSVLNIIKPYLTSEEYAKAVFGTGVLFVGVTKKLVG